MGIVQALEYRLPKPNPVQRAMRQVASSRPGAWVFSRSMHHIDRFLLRITRGRIALPQVAAGIPVTTVITTGARSGRRRAAPLLGIPHGDDLAIIGTHFGQAGTPGWYYNLRTDPEAEIVFRDRRVKAVAREAEGDEWRAIWDRAREFYSGYDLYAKRIHDRPIHIMVLTESTDS
jgi:deazaflavin-dependent oxidoreductase (nitroreductase family)